MEEMIEQVKNKEKDEKIIKLEKENQELKETIINMSKIMYTRDVSLTKIIEQIERELRTISRRK